MNKKISPMLAMLTAIPSAMTRSASVPIDKLVLSNLVDGTGDYSFLPKATRPWWMRHRFVRREYHSPSVRELNRQCRRDHLDRRARNRNYPGWCMNNDMPF
jgi:hypothetical protein